MSVATEAPIATPEPLVPSPPPSPLAVCARFDGLTQLHAWEFDQGKVFYRSRHLYPALERHVSQTGRYSGFACAAGSTMLGTLGRRLLQALRLVAPRQPNDPTSRFNVGVTVGPIAQQ